VALTTPFQLKAGATALRALRTYTSAEFREWLRSVGGEIAVFD
jgi:hypothetical protein